MDPITLGGATYAPRLPSFADREDIVRGFREAGASVRKSRKIFAATVVLCVPELAPEGASLDAADGDALAYGEVAYEALRARGATASEISTAGLALFGAVVKDLYPRADEVEKAEDFSEAGAPRT